MKSRHFVELIERAVVSSNRTQLSLIAAQLHDAQRAREILRAKGYGTTGTSASATAAQVPNAPHRD